MIKTLSKAVQIPSSVEKKPVPDQPSLLVTLRDQEGYTHELLFSHLIYDQQRQAYNCDRAAPCFQHDRKKLNSEIRQLENWLEEPLEVIDHELVKPIPQHEWETLQLPKVTSTQEIHLKVFDPDSDNPDGCLQYKLMYDGTIAENMESIRKGECWEDIKLLGFIVREVPIRIPFDY